MKNSLRKGLITLTILAGLQVSAMAAPTTNTEVSSTGSVVGYFLLLVALIVAPAFKGARKHSH